MTDTGSPRAREMVARLGREWTDAGFEADDRGGLQSLATTVMRERSRRFSDEHHPAFLHPLRTVTLLLEADEVSLIAHRSALLLDTETAPDAPPAEPVPPALSELLATRDDEMLEALVVVEPWLLTTWLAERLDQIRHMHLWAGESRTADLMATAEVREVPLAHRAGGRLARAWTDWMEKAQRYRLVAKAQVRRISE